MARGGQARSDRLMGHCPCTRGRGFPSRHGAWQDNALGRGASSPLPKGAGPSWQGLGSLAQSGQDFLLPVCAALGQAPASPGSCLRGAVGPRAEHHSLVPSQLCGLGLGLPRPEPWAHCHLRGQLCGWGWHVWAQLAAPGHSPWNRAAEPPACLRFPALVRCALAATCQHLSSPRPVMPRDPHGADLGVQLQRSPQHAAPGQRPCSLTHPHSPTRGLLRHLWSRIFPGSVPGSLPPCTPSPTPACLPAEGGLQLFSAV